MGIKEEERLVPIEERKAVTMKYTVAIMVSALLFAVLGLFAACGVAAYATPAIPIPGGKPPEFAYFAVMFTLLPLGGAVVGLVIGAIGSVVGHRFGQNSSAEKNRSAG
jgi:TRAP-type C4-dicarboxylate transport system permease small subunit